MKKDINKKGIHPFLTNMEGPKMMVWKRYLPLKSGNFWYQFVRFLGCKLANSTSHIRLSTGTFPAKLSCYGAFPKPPNGRWKDICFFFQGCFFLCRKERNMKYIILNNNYNIRTLFLERFKKHGRFGISDLWQIKWYIFQIQYWLLTWSALETKVWKSFPFFIYIYIYGC